MYRTDKQFMKNPATASSRIYIGSIAENVIAADLEDRFKNHGKILGLVLQRGFGFIQYEADVQAQAAIRNEHGSMFCGRKLNVRQAVDKTRLGGPQIPPQQAPAPRAPPTPPPQQIPTSQPASRPPSLMQKRISPPKQNPPVEEMETNVEEEFQRDKSQEMDQDSQNHQSEDESDRHKRRRGAQPGNKRDRDRERHRDHDRFRSDDFNMRDMPPRDMPPRDLPPRDLPPRDLPPRDLPPRDLPSRDLPPRDLPPRDMPLYFGREDPYRSGPGFVPPPIIDRPERNDCEIIVVSKLLTEYAEYIEQRLKSVGLVVDLLFPNEDVPIGRVLANISSRGCLFAILVMPQNEEYRTLTLSILHGITQEHRNMPVDDAVVLITRNFDAYMRGEKTGVATSGTLTDRHPEQVQMVFNLLAENRQISTSQYDRILKYLQERRELQSQFEVAEGGGDGNIEPEPNSKQAELQSRIMNILNKSADDAPKPVEAPKPQPSGPTPLLNDPSVQKALDSLLSGDMFKTITSNL